MKTNITDWIIRVLVHISASHDANDPAGAESLANKVSATGSGNDEWF